MLLVNDVSAGYGKLQVLYGVSVEVGRGNIVALLGPNGSGKSTLLKTVFGLTTVYSGTVTYNGRDITYMPPHARARLGIAYLPQVGNVFGNLTVEENLKMAAYTISRDTFLDRLDKVYGLFPILREFRKRRAGQLSGGQRQMLGIAMALIRDAKLIILDEPTAMLAPKAAQEIADTIVELRRNGITILLAEQNAMLATDIADRVYILASGRVIFEGSPGDLLARPDLGKLYLGLTR